MEAPGVRSEETWLATDGVSASAARDFVSGVLERWELRPVVPDARLVVAQLLDAGPAEGDVQVRVRGDGDRVCIEVYRPRLWQSAEEPMVVDLTRTPPTVLTTYPVTWGQQRFGYGQLTWADLRLPG